MPLAIVVDNSFGHPERLKLAVAGRAATLVVAIHMTFFVLCALSFRIHNYYARVRCDNSCYFC